MAKKTAGGDKRSSNMRVLPPVASEPVTYAEIRGWFAPHMPPPSEMTLTGLYHNINHYRDIYSRRDAKIANMNANPARTRSFRVNEALQILISDLPDILDDLGKAIGCMPDDEEYRSTLITEQSTTAQLLNVAQKTSEFFKQYNARSRGRVPEWWHHTLSRLFEIITIDWKDGVKPPAVKIQVGLFNVALTKIGFNLTDDAVLKALQKIRK
jgi:hypothetical protein